MMTNLPVCMYMYEQKADVIIIKICSKQNDTLNSEYLWQGIHNQCISMDFT